MLLPFTTLPFIIVDLIKIDIYTFIFKILYSAILKTIDSRNYYNIYIFCLFTPFILQLNKGEI